jgi:hypothetical protein
MQKWVFIILGVLLAALLTTYLYISLFIGQADDCVSIYLKSDDKVEVAQRNWLVFTPKNQPVRAGFAFYPGGFVDAKAYARTGFSLASNGVLTVILPVPLRIAWLNRNEASNVIAAFPKISNWFVGGHSLGGILASFYSRENTKRLKGIILYAAFLPDKYKSKDLKLPVLSIYGTKDANATLIEGTKNNLSSNTTLYKIQGGNHAQFGSYTGSFFKDNEAAISREEQQSIAENETLEFIFSTLSQ